MPKHVVFILSVVISSVAASHAQDLQAIEARSNEVRSLHPLACTEQQSARLDQYRQVLLPQALRELRINLQDFSQNLPKIALLAAVRERLAETVKKQLEALGDDSTNPCEASAAFIKLELAQSYGADAGIKVSPQTIRFPDKEAGDSAEALLSIENRWQASVSLGSLELCDGSDLSKQKCLKQCGNQDKVGCEKKCQCIEPEAFTLQTADEACPSLLLHDEHCNVKVVFRPNMGGVHRATLRVSLVNPPAGSSAPTVEIAGKGYVANIITLNGTESVSTPTFRSVVGFDISGASSARTEQKAFVEFNLNAPLWPGGKDPLNKRLWAFFNPRITSLPQSNSALSALNVQGFSDFFNSKQTDLVQGVDVQGGIEVLLLKPRNGVPFFASYKNTRARTGVALVFGAGFSTPFSTPQNTPTVFSLPQDSALRQEFDVPASFSNIAFVNRERSRFFRKYYAGLRFKTYHFSSLVQGECDEKKPDQDKDQLPCEGVFNLFPGIIDVTAGQDEQVTGGHLSGWVFRLDTVYPLPFAPAFHLFGSLNSAIERNRSGNAFTLPTVSNTPITDTSVFIYNVDPRNRDIYRLGLGVDILQVLKKPSTQTRIDEKPKVSDSSQTTEQPKTPNQKSTPESGNQPNPKSRGKT